MALRYYSTRRKRKDGWMTLTLKSGKHKIDIESTLPHFADIVARAAYAAKAGEPAARPGHTGQHGRDWREGGRVTDPLNGDLLRVPNLLTVRDLKVDFVTTAVRHPGGARRLLPRAPGRHRGAGRRIRLGQIGHQPRRSWASCRGRRASPAAQILFDDRDGSGGRIVDIAGCRATARRCAPSAAAASPSSSRSR